MVKKSFANVGNAGLIPGGGKTPRRRKWQPTPVFLTGKFHGQRSLVGYSPWGRKESDMAEWVNTCGESRFLWGWHILGTAGGPLDQSRVSKRENEEVWGATEERGYSEGDGKLWKLRVSLHGGGTRLGLGYNRISPATMFTNRDTQSQATIIIWTANSHALDQVITWVQQRGWEVVKCRICLEGGTKDVPTGVKKKIDREVKDGSKHFGMINMFGGEFQIKFR